MIAEDELSDVVLTSIACQYPPVGKISWWDSLDEFPSRGFCQRTLGIPLSDLPLRESPQLDFGRIFARCLTEFQQDRCITGDKSRSNISIRAWRRKPPLRLRPKTSGSGVECKHGLAISLHPACRDRLGCALPRSIPSLRRNTLRALTTSCSYLTRPDRCLGPVGSHDLWPWTSQL